MYNWVVETQEHDNGDKIQIRAKEGSVAVFEARNTCTSYSNRLLKIY